METSGLERGLTGKTTWKNLCTKYQAEKARFLFRKDGIMTSGEIGLRFDSSDVIVTGEQVQKLCQSAISGEIDLSDIQFLATAILLSGFDFDADNTEDTLHFLSTLGSEVPLKLTEIQKASRMINSN